ncbi:MAG: Oligopeptidase A [Candidatus Heimdallarchaeota archaeon LC_2]|nr:MAG: Oligopeptidase A [Candidatus Heimdallarchaeota archaeon LC_2]
MEYEKVLSKSMEIISALDWTLSPEEITQKTQELIDLGNVEYEKIVSIPSEQRFFANVVKKLDLISLQLTNLNASLYFPAYMSTDSEIRKISNEASQTISKYFIEVGMREDLYQAVKDAKQNSRDNLDTIDSRLVERQLRDFRRNGLDLEDSIKVKIKSIRKELAKLSIEFSQVLNEIKDTVEYTESELSGIPESTISNFKKDESGNYLVGMSYPEVLPVLDYAKDSNTRAKMAKVYGNRGIAEGNVARLEKAITLKDELAKLKGYENHAEFMLEVKMAKNPKNVIDFIDDLIVKLKPKGISDLDLLVKEKQKDGDSETKINFEDWRYYKRVVVENDYNVDDEVIKQYFPMKKTVEGMLQFYQDLLSLIFIELNNVPKWHDHVQVYAILDKNTDNFIGIFYLDLFPRDGKFNHAAAFPLIHGRQMENGSYCQPVAAMECNFTKPTKETPSLLQHSEVVTLYHEFGHIMHQTITKSRYATFSGSSVSRDFVEAPSQMLENWIWEPMILSKITSHYKTGEVMPMDLVDKLVKSRDAFSGLTDLRQLFFGKYDMIAHTNSQLESQKLWHELQEETSLIPPYPKTNPAASFGHIMGGYDAGYYGYMWSKVIAQDMFTKFQENGITSSDIGMDYRRHILEHGNDFDENELVERFLGRKTNNKAFLKSLGLEN